MWTWVLLCGASEDRSRSTHCGVISTKGPRGLIYVVNSTDQNTKVDAEAELDNLVIRESPDTVVFALANTLTRSIATLSGQKLSDVCVNEGLCL